ncbi:hypothetical protein BE08_44740 [Sorangium cellulosum]|uniref:Uncharacterized protein n=1 Tax=Sorangium cellulosum TaxID=56 RepID=A0A150PPE7_SORCE|nr:hypothetical protein BE08_44740 [Sorangium cellulosum]
MASSGWALSRSPVSATKRAKTSARHWSLSWFNASVSSSPNGSLASRIDPAASSAASRPARRNDASRVSSRMTAPATRFHAYTPNGTPRAASYPGLASRSA